MTNNKLILFSILIGFIIIPSCKKVEKEMLVSTGTVTNILINTVDVSGKILDLGEGATQYGHCYSKTANPIVASTKTEHSSPSLGDFTSTLEGLEAGTKYYVKAYLGRGKDVVYGNEINFTTASAALPELATTAISSITKISAVSGGNITNQGGTPVTARGVCWSLATITTLTNNKTTDGTGTGTFTSDITALTAGTNYYVRAYATNSGGTKLGNEVTFTTTTDAPVQPTVTTADVSLVTSNSAICGGNVTSEGSASVTTKGVCWGTSANPTPANFKTENGYGLGSFVSNLTGLNPGTIYYVRAYATNNGGTLYSYGDEKSFTTNIVAPALTSLPVTSITATTATSGGDITNLGGSNISVKGVCWSLTSQPTINDFITTDGPTSVLGTFVSSITGLSPNTQYYVRSYATNSAGISYGNELSFTALASVTTTTISNIAATAASGGGTIAVGGGASITARGVCWSTFTNPTIVNSHTSDGSDSGSFTSSLTGLTSNTTYYIRAYATNSGGTSYGNQQIFTTLASVTTAAISNITSITASSGGNIDPGGGVSITSRGVCWSTNQNPTIVNNHTSDGSGSGSFISSLIGLSSATNYYVRAYATNSSGTAYGDQKSFLSTITWFDVDGNQYNTVKIGTHLWMMENLKTTKYNDGTSITLVTDGTAWSNLSTPGYCWYNNDAATYKNPYGALYNWYTVNTGKLCLGGWHMPSDAEWTELTNYLGGASLAGNKLKESGTIHWTSPNTGATNETGFTALPGGFRSSLGTFMYIGNNTSLWSATEANATTAYYRYMSYNISDVLGGSTIKKIGGYVRCIRDY